MPTSRSSNAAADRAPTADTGQGTPAPEHERTGHDQRSQRQDPADQRRQPPCPAAWSAGTSVAVIASGDRGRARNPTPNAFTNVATPSPAVSATAATASGIGNRHRHVRRPGHRQAVDEPLQQQPLGDEPVARRQRRRTKRPDPEQRGRRRHPTRQTTQLVQVAEPGGSEHGAGAQEQQRLERGVVDGMQERRGQQQAGQRRVTGCGEQAGSRRRRARSAPCSRWSSRPAAS